MNKELLNEQLALAEIRNPGLRLLVPGDLTSQETADNLIALLQKMYVEHGITKNKEKVISDIETGNVLTWFAKKDQNFVATASLVKQSGGAWELGRAVSLDQGNGIGKRVILEALKFHIENHSGETLTAEVRAAAEFKGIPSGAATQKIFFDTISRILPMTPFAVAPLFAHGDPLRNEQFILSASDVKPGKTITERIAEVTNNRSTRGVIPRVKVVQTVPFQVVEPDDSGDVVSRILHEVDNFNGCTLFPIESTDRNMPLIGMLSAQADVVVCGVDRVMGKEGKPVLFIAKLGFVGEMWTGKVSELAPSQISEVLPRDLRDDIQNISDRFIAIRNKKVSKHNEELKKFWKIEMNWPGKDDEEWEG